MKHFISIIVFVVAASFCFAQQRKNNDKLIPAVKVKVDSLFPKASYRIVQGDYFTTDTTQSLEITNYNDGQSHSTVIDFDTNGKILWKDIYYETTKYLPDTIANFLKSRTSQSFKFFDNFMIKHVDNKGETEYKVLTQESKGSLDLRQYYVTFKSTGEIISKENAMFPKD